MKRLVLLACLSFAATACGDDGTSLDLGVSDVGPDSGIDVGTPDSGADTGPRDQGFFDGATDAGVPDTGDEDAGLPDLGADLGTDAGADTGPSDAAPDAGAMDTGAMDTGAMDTGAMDTGAMDAGPADTGADSGCPRPEIQGTPSVYVGPAPIAYYTFDDAHRDGADVLDVSGALNDAVANPNAAAALGGAGPVHEGASFDGASTLIDASPAKSQVFSTAVWINPASWPTNERKIILNQGNGPSAWQGWGMLIRPNGTVGVFVEGGGGAVNEHGTSSNACVARGEWTHLAATFDGTAVRLYQNGVLQQTTPTNLSTINYGANELVFGRHSFFQNAYYDGDIDEFALFDQVLTAADIGQIYLAGRDGLHFTCPQRCGPQTPPAATLPTNGRVAWFRADRGVNSGADGLACTWCDQSAAEHHVQTNGPSDHPQPVASSFGGQPTMHFPLTGSQALQRSGDLTITSTNGRTFFTVYQLLDANRRTRVFSQGVTGTPGTYLQVEANTFNSTNNSYGFYVTNNAYQSNVPTSTDPVIHTARLSSMVPGTPVLNASDVFINTLPATLTRTPGGLGNTLIEAFSPNFAAVGPATGGANVSEVIVYDRPLTDLEREQVETYLVTRYGIPVP